MNIGNIGKEIKKKFTVGLFVLYAATLVACGKTTDDAVGTLKAAVEALENEDEKNFEDALPLAKKEIDKILEKEGDSSETFKAMYLQMLANTVEYVNYAKNALDGLQAADETGAFQTIQDVNDAEKNNLANKTQRELAMACRGKIATDYNTAQMYISEARKSLDACKGANVNPDYDQTISMTEKMLTELETEIGQYSQKVEATIGLSEQLGGNLEDAMAQISSAISFLKEGDYDKYTEAMKDAKKFISTSEKNASKDDDYTTAYQTAFIEALCTALEDTSDAKRGLDGLQAADKTGAFQTIQATKTAEEKVSEEQQELADQFEKLIFDSYIITTTNLNSATGGLDTCEEATIGAYYDNTVDSVDAMVVDLATQLEPYSEMFQETFELTDEEMETLNTSNAEPGQDSNIFTKSIEDLYKQVSNGGSSFDQALNNFKLQWQKKWNEFLVKFTNKLEDLRKRAEQGMQRIYKQAQDGSKNLLQKILEDDKAERERGIDR